MIGDKENIESNRKNRDIAVFYVHVRLVNLSVQSVVAL